ncbi:MAG: hypothetical protein CVU55_06980 [Deltaproteobacteria bacterium HGW-Deltaproteobacteria-13]|jgi:hypothetical protein|nr:MAG: hypothetical protein CVU55_06980 [Deltaproteobacteria bacterium HGW-Deltaproteobacteria-13]
MGIGRISTPVLLSFLIIMFMTVMGCGKMEASSVISGTLTGDAYKNVTIRMTGDSTTSITTDANGKFSFSNVENGHYTITPSVDGYSFAPESQTVTVSGASVTGIDFVSTWSGYSISGTVTGPGKEGVTLTLKKGDALIGSTTTDADGKYTITNITLNGDYTITPKLAGYKFTPYVTTPPITINSASTTAPNFVSETIYAAGTAQGTYTWNSMTGVLEITWSAADFPCNWPKAGLESVSHVTISKTTMTWPGAIQWPGLMIWTRTSAAANDPAGVWTTTDQSGNTYTATISTSGSISLTGNMIACAYAWSSSDYKVSLSYQDPAHAETSVSVKGSGILTSLDLTYGAGEWTTPIIDISAEHTPPYVYTFTIVGSATIWEETSCFVDWAAPSQPAGSISTATPTFSWIKNSDAGASYVVQVLYGSTLIWESASTTSTTALYNGPALIAGHTYDYYVQVRGTSACPHGKSISVAGSFAYNPSP